MANIFDMTKVELQSFLIDKGIKKFRADQIFHYIYKQFIFDWNDMPLLPKADRILLEKELPFHFPKIISRQESPDRQTVKILLGFRDGNTVETVLMMHNYGNSICISSQVGCAVNCAFCASAKNGFIRNLTAGEMISQILAFKKYVTPDLHSIVIMGTGEPLLNYDNVLSFMRLIHEKDTFYLGYRNITLSTSGIVPPMYELAKEGLPITLAISLHAPTNELRRRIMPITDTYPLEDVLTAAGHYFNQTGRKVTFEYILIKDFNCTAVCARQLAQLMSGKNILINAIPINDNYDVGLHRPSSSEITNFITYLQNHNINITLRKEMGSKIQAACGQLRIQRKNI
ncbi:23S rRNA methyltransferase [Megasphaera cerevisiae DSM 20462]|jgi:23S rRNA (adenine2503-C2)-methyltransferase|uniref:Probable dual-specificity RNA methyltransferase RlmN n=1 Tax=Megasphaera cerevisiae DSM 20462 TaxID=1122219 RepID=A0A0J6ZSH5_9FIRM|nr:23S rRNA (adenine(2503)-C(2))-methyltransferase RlmN [Megasphaera cerevisiae]KMO87911.1 23S rRNA methyltransferase [Megasphaera cerevisiae DSM 20462]MCI1750077.1 23S rRNA (adenine(2503)-C(2))-methyltransferase RlmN [Megasphaera cerevisiae]OKY53652.1 23S rRNA (adenine(2503)-C(2))-methyltransferase [Megasphaera cerevisiae]SJZ43396.1 23S rRNA (adenine2503-C2)-methyltransferase [Megasphaera cerevisiae DSM 20462]